VCLTVCVITETPKGALCSSWEPTGKVIFFRTHHYISTGSVGSAVVYQHRSKENQVRTVHCQLTVSIQGIILFLVFASQSYKQFEYWREETGLYSDGYVCI
jgi:hypothetical protein